MSLDGLARFAGQRRRRLHPSDRADGGEMDFDKHSQEKEQVQ